MLALEMGAEVAAVEKFDAAFGYLRENLARYPQLAVEAVQGDVLAPAFAASVPGGFDFIVSNPPYIETGSSRTYSARYSASRGRRSTAGRTVSSLPRGLRAVG